MNFIQMAALCEQSRNGTELGDDNVVGLCRMRRTHCKVKVRTNEYLEFVYHALRMEVNTIRGRYILVYIRTCCHYMRYVPEKYAKV